MQTITIYVDDSGVLHTNEESGYFVYAGYVFLNRDSRERKTREYRKLALDICKKLNIQEAKASCLKPNNKRALMNIMKDIESFSVISKIDVMLDRVMCDAKSRHRFKDFALKIAIKRKIEVLISEGKIDASIPTQLNILIDEQPTSTNGFYSLQDSILEEFSKGFSAFDYSAPKERLFYSTLVVDIKYKSSHKDFMIQASDILANRVWNLSRTNRLEILNLNNHNMIHCPSVSKLSTQTERKI